jgi:hypothetical protein
VNDSHDPLAPINTIDRSMACSGSSPVAHRI